MAKWQPRMTPGTEAALRALGPYSVAQGGYLLWDSAPGFEWPSGQANLGFGVHPREAVDADYLRLLDAWRQVCDRQAATLNAIRLAITASADDADFGDDPLAAIQGAHFALSTAGIGIVRVEVTVAAPWDEEHGVTVDLVPPDDRTSWHFA